MSTTKQKYYAQTKLGLMTAGFDGKVLDSDINYFADELTRVSASVYEKTYEDSVCERVLPQLSEGNTFDEIVRLPIIDKKGRYTVSKGIAESVATVSTSKGKLDLPAVSIQSAAKYNMMDLVNMATTGRSVSAEQLMACRDQWQYAKEDSAFAGINTDDGFTYGLFHYLQSEAGAYQMQEYTNPADGDVNGGTNSTYLQHKTPDQVRNLLVGAIERAENTYKKRELGLNLMMILPSEIVTLLKAMPWSDNNSSTTMYLWLLEAYRQERLRIEKVAELSEVTLYNETTNSFGIIYPMRPEYIAQVTTHDFQIGALEQRHFQYEQQTIGRLAGVAVREPLACTFIKSISNA